jgi:dUTP pyrophosphatase
MKQVSILIHARHPELIPCYATKEAAGCDIRADLNENIVLAPGTFVAVPTGLFFEIPEGFEVQIRPRSGLAAKYGVTVLNAPGTIDSDYRGEIKILLINHSSTPFVIEPKMRIAQMIVAPVVQAHFQEVEELNTTARGAGGFGHTGLN